MKKTGLYSGSGHNSRNTLGVYCRHRSISWLDFTVAAVIHLFRYKLSRGVFCFLINDWCQTVSDREPERASGRVCLCVVVLCGHVFQAAASGRDLGVNHTAARATTGSIATTAARTRFLCLCLVLSRTWRYICLSSPITTIRSPSNTSCLYCTCLHPLL